MAPKAKLKPRFSAHCPTGIAIKTASFPTCMARTDQGLMCMLLTVCSRLDRCQTGQTAHLRRCRDTLAGDMREGTVTDSPDCLNERRCLRLQLIQAAKIVTVCEHQ